MPGNLPLATWVKVALSSLPRDPPVARKPEQAGNGFRDDMPGMESILGRIERFCPWPLRGISGRQAPPDLKPVQGGIRRRSIFEEVKAHPISGPIRAGWSARTGSRQGGPARLDQAHSGRRAWCPVTVLHDRPGPLRHPGGQKHLPDCNTP